MLSSLLTPSLGRRNSNNRSRPNSLQPPNYIQRNERSIEDRSRQMQYHHQASASEDEHENESGDDEDHNGSSSSDLGAEEEEAQSLLPIFSPTRLDALPVFMLTHTIRVMVISRCETVLSWEQLRSPQVSQFLLKPMEQEIRANHFTAATQCALMANCLQFVKEAHNNPGNSGTSRTRAMVCELIAIKLLREHSTRELIDALSYDFDPLQGQEDPIQEPNNPRASWQPARRLPQRSARISCLEIAIRAQSKRFLAHPLVVQHLEAIWNGSIVFHAAADSMHRRQNGPFKETGYGTLSSMGSIPVQRPTARHHKTVTLYNPRDASLFKLSRLRVPRYRNILSTISFAVLLGLFLAVLIQRSLEITALEVVFWIWAGGYMLDEVIGFNEQGFGLYITSFWNTFDIGIMVLLFVHLCLRLYGIIMPDVRKHRTADRAYDVLAADAVLLFPRLFSVLDHYRYFSQLIIAFRMMAADMVAIFVLIIIFCSGFLVALTLAFGNDGIDSPSAVAYALLQMLLGFTPAAWDRWDGYNWGGKMILTLFLFICHFVVVTILITVLTNSFMEIVRNANEEHQFLFAVNTISSVKSDALFAYVAPTNVIQWALTPLRYVLSFRQYIRLNRMIIKLTHFPVLFTIYFYEKTVLQFTMVESMDLVENRGREKKSLRQKFPRLIREPSIATFRQDAALEEVFKRPVDSTIRTGASRERRKASNVVSTWMNNIDEDTADPPQEQDRKIVDRLEKKKLRHRRLQTPNSARGLSGRMSAFSDPADLTSHADFFLPVDPVFSVANTTPSHIDPPAQQTDADGDDELLTNDYDDDDRLTIDRSNTVDDDVEHRAPQSSRGTDYFSRPSHPRIMTPEDAGSAGSGAQTRFLASPFGAGMPSQSGPRKDQHPRPHLRNVSSATIIFNPPTEPGTAENSLKGTEMAAIPERMLAAIQDSTSQAASSKPSSGAGRKTPKRGGALRLRPFLPTNNDAVFRSTPNLATVLARSQNPEEGKRKRRSSLEMDLVSDIGDNKAIGGGYVGAIPASFAAHMPFSNGAKRHSMERNEEQEMFGRLMMARMNSLEEGFRDVIHEMRESIKNSPSRNRSPERPVRPIIDKRRTTHKGKERSGERDTNRSQNDGGSNKENTDPGTGSTPVTPRMGSMSPLKNVETQEFDTTPSQKQASGAANREL